MHLIMMLQTLTDSTSTHCLEGWCVLHLIQWKNIYKSYHYFIPSIIHLKLNQSSYISKLYIASSQPFHPPPLDSSTFSPNPDAQKINQSTSVWSPYFFKMARCPLLYNSPERKWTPQLASVKGCSHGQGNMQSSGHKRGISRPQGK